MGTRSEETARFSRRTVLEAGAAGAAALGVLGLGAGLSEAQAQVPPAQGQGPTITRPSVSLAAAKALIEAAEAASVRQGIPNNITVVDIDGRLKAFHSMDGAVPLTVTVSYNKAYTSATFGVATHEFAQAVSGNPGVLASVANIPNMALIGGGFPLKVGGVVVGGFGVSGQGTPDQDIDVAQAALAAAWNF